MPSIARKECRECRKKFDRTTKHFSTDTKAADGLKGICRTCDNRARTERSRRVRASQKQVEDLSKDKLVSFVNHGVETAYWDKNEIFHLNAENDGKLLKYLIIPDCHIPYHDRKAFALMLKAAGVLRPDVIINLGDFSDFYCVSSHDKNPNRTTHLEDELKEVNTCFDLLDGLGAKQKVFIAGNHEDRLERYLMTKAPELFNLVQIPELFHLKERGWEYIPYKKHFKVGHIYITHDTGRAGRYAIYQSLADVGTNTVIGHTHRLSYAVEGNAEGKSNVAASFGWLGDFEKIDYMHRIRCLRDWTLGFGIAYFDTKTNIMHIQPVPIVEYQCVVEGKLITL